jgi:hypothetical protein
MRLNLKKGGYEYQRHEVLKATPWKREEVFRMSRYLRRKERNRNLGVYVLLTKDRHDRLLRYRFYPPTRKAASSKS